MARDIVFICMILMAGYLNVVRSDVLLKDPDLGAYCEETYNEGKNSILYSGQRIPISKCPKGRDLLLRRVEEEARVELRSILDESDPEICCPLDQCPPPTHKQPDSKDDHFVESWPEPPVCGLSKNFVIPKVVEGEDAPLRVSLAGPAGVYPSRAIQLRSTGSCRRSCSCGDKIQWNGGGSLITHRHVLTAAHCIKGVEKYLYVVRLGELDFASEIDGASPRDYHIQKITLHEQYDKKTKSNDIGIITLNEDVQFNDFIQPICLPFLPNLKGNNFNMYMPFVAGWGATQYGGSKASHLQYAQLSVVSNDQCEDKYSKASNKIDSRILCAGSRQNKDSCTGDSGGPLMLPHKVEGKSYFFAIGVVSYGYRCGSPGYPGVYSRVTEFLPWIASQTTGKD